MKMIRAALFSAFFLIGTFVSALEPIPDKLVVLGFDDCNKSDRNFVAGVLKKYGFGLSSVRFICGTQDIHNDLENKVANFLNKEDSILYTSCFDANGGLFETLLNKEDAIISDSLNHEIEIRIYQIGGITNYNSLFRMFKDNSEKWTAKFYEHYSKVDKQSKIRILEKSVKSEHDMDFVYQNLLRSHILELSNLDDIKWKLESRGPVIPFENKVNGELVKEYGFIINKNF